MLERKDDVKTYELVNNWLREYQTAPNRIKRTRVKALIVTQMMPIIKRIAHTIARRAYDPIDDLVQAGSIGLLKAIDSYSVDLNDNFKIYAGYLIIGEMKHYLRDKMNTIRVPRHIQELTYRINSFTRSLTLEELNDLTNDDVAEVLKVSPNAINVAIEADRRKSTVSLDEVFSTESDSLSYEEMLSKDDYSDSLDIADTKIVLRDLIEKLPDESKTLIKLFYYDDMNKKEIAEKLNLTQMTVSRKFKKAFSQLYKMIADGDFENEDVEDDFVDDESEAAGV